MSTIGKIFTVLNLILAAAFLGWAAHALNVNQEWRQKYEKNVADTTKAKSEVDAELKAANARLVQLDKDLQARVGENSDLKNAKERLDATVLDLTKKGTEMQASLDKIALTLQGIEEQKTALQNEKDKADKAMRDAETARGAAQQAQTEAEKTANQLKADNEKAQNSIADLEKQKTDLQKQRSSLETQLQTLVANTNANPADFMPVPDIQGGVLDVSMAVAPGIVALNVGSNKGVKRGYTFEIYDGKTYKGQARVEFVHGDMSSAIITRTVPGQTIRQGDSASTRL
jgi:hypothetical protein